MENTLYFEEVQIKATVTTNTVSPFPRRPHNANSAQKYYKYRRGRDGQTQGNYQGDYLGHIPACAYHMPRNQNRADDPRMFLPYKKKGDIIEATDLNNLYDRLDGFLHAWNAEANDLFGYGISSKLRNPVGKNYSALIVSQNSFPEASNGISPRLNSGSSWYGDKFGLMMVKRRNLEEILAAFSDTNEINKTKEYPLGSTLPFNVPVSIMNGSIVNPTYTTGTNIHSSETVKNIYNSTLAARPSYRGNEYYNFGRVNLMPATIEVGNAGEANFVIGKNPDGSPIYWMHTPIGNSPSLYALNKNLNEMIYTVRDYNEDPFKPSISFYGIKIVTLDHAHSGTARGGAYINFNDVTRYKRGEYPLIGTKEWKNTRLTIKNLLDKILSISGIAFSGQIDTVTKMEIETFYSQQSGTTDTVNKDNPEGTFNNYQAVPGAIIKIDFYNTLIDAYRILVNSCLCNSDCSCNVDCVCNVNCGCNYG